MTIREAWKIYMGVWTESNKLCDKGNKLLAEGSKLQASGHKLLAAGSKLQPEGLKLYAESNKLHAEGSKLYAEGSKLDAESNKLHAEGRIAFLDVVISTLGNVQVKWIACWDSVEIAGVVYTTDLQDSWNAEPSCDGKVVEIDGKKYQLRMLNE